MLLRAHELNRKPILQSSMSLVSDSDERVIYAPDRHAAA
jgi:hypothetical protein